MQLVDTGQTDLVLVPLGIASVCTRLYAQTTDDLSPLLYVLTQRVAAIITPTN